MQPFRENSEIFITMSIVESQLARLRERCHVIQGGWGKTGVRLSENELCEKVESTDILLVGYENISRRVVESAKNLKLIGVSRSNPINVDMETVNQKKIPVLHTPGRNSIAAAEFTIGLMLSQARNIGKGDQSLRNGKYTGKPLQDVFQVNPTRDLIWNIDGDSPYTHLRGRELNGCILGLIGLGNVAVRVATIAKAFGMQVITYSPDRDAERARELGITRVSLDRLLSESDFISIHCSVTQETRALLGNEEFKLMKPSAYLINTARASVVDQKALIVALQSNQIAGAALDVFWYEPLPANHPLLGMDNVIMTPHLAGSTQEVPERHSKMLVDDVIAWMDGGKPLHVFNEEILRK